MSQSIRTGLERSGTAAVADDFGDRIEAATLGTDDEGYEHHYIRSADAVVVVDPDTDTVERVERLDGRRLVEWQRFVGVQRGWTSLGPCAAPLLRADRRRKESA